MPHCLNLDLPDFKDYEEMMPDMCEQAFVIDDISQYKSDMMIETFKPDIFCAGIKEKYVLQKHIEDIGGFENFQYLNF